MTFLRSKWYHIVGEKVSQLHKQETILKTPSTLSLLSELEKVEVIPVYADYRESSYMILDHATMTITTDSSGIIDRTNQVVVVDANGNDYHLKLQSDFLLDRGISYTGTIVYLKHSDYVIWYDLNL